MIPEAKATENVILNFGDQQPIDGVLVVDDDPVFRQVMSYALTSRGFHADEAKSIRHLEERIGARHYSAVLLDLMLGDENGLDAIPLLTRVSPATRVIVLTGFGSVDTAVKAMQLGAATYLSKDRSPLEIVQELQKIIAPSRLTGRQLNACENFGLIGNSLSMRKVIELIDRLKDIDSTIVITGESGTGKEVVARALHRASKRACREFQALNCAAIPEQLLESELFGYMRGSFTDAKNDRAGIFEICSEGTLFLDEISEMPLGLQAKLLRVLQEREVTPIGSNRSIKINTRVVASTNRDLLEEVRQGRFREDLYFRISVLRIALPPLRERKDDIPLLLEHFVNEFNAQFERQVSVPSHEVVARLRAFDWPGNVRELRNMIERGVVLSQDGILRVDDMMPGPCLHRWPNDAAETFFDVTRDDIPPLPEAKNRMEEAYLRKALKFARGNVSEAARISGLYRANLYRLMARYGINPGEFKQTS